MSNNNQKEITNEGLANRIDALAANQESLAVNQKELTQLVESIARNLADFQKDTKESLADLTKGLFTEQEKEEVLAMVRHYDKWLEADVKGENRITLTRGEYEAASRAQGFPNRFIGVPVVDIE
jgi:ABC-type transporter MlaC component